MAIVTASSLLGGGVKSIQRGTIYLANATPPSGWGSTLVVSISSINAAKAQLQFLGNDGLFSGVWVPSTPGTYSSGAVIKVDLNATNITFTVLNPYGTTATSVYTFFNANWNVLLGPMMYNGYGQYTNSLNYQIVEYF